MANTYTQLHIHYVFAVKSRKALIAPLVRERVEKYITGLVQNKGHKMLAIYLMPDHAHVFIGYNPKFSISETVSVMKSESTNFINEYNLCPFHFQWQNGYGAFSHSRSAVPKVIKYIRNQPEHHKTKNFKREFISLLKKFEVEYDNRYLFDFFD